jgi:hypothetical protein
MSRRRFLARRPGYRTGESLLVSHQNVALPLADAFAHHRTAMSWR